jgi:hypothetical protein
LLAGSLAAVLAAGCTSSPSPTGGPPSPTKASPPPPPPDPDLPVLRKSLATERALAASVLATGRRIPALAKGLAPYASRHQQHVAAFAPAAASPSPTPVAAPVPAAQAAAVAALVKAERAAQLVHHAALQTVKSSDHALLLASLAACAAAHAVALEGLADAD